MSRNSWRRGSIKKEFVLQASQAPFLCKTWAFKQGWKDKPHDIFLADDLGKHPRILEFVTVLNVELAIFTWNLENSKFPAKLYIISKAVDLFHFQKDHSER